MEGGWTAVNARQKAKKQQKEIGKKDEKHSHEKVTIYDCLNPSSSFKCLL
jgi:hypothetical protein